MSPALLWLRPDLGPWLALAPLSVAALAWAQRRRRRRLLAVVGPRLDALTTGAPGARGRLGAWAWGLGLALGLLAALSPAWGAPVAPPAWRGADLVVALDLSRSMLAGDLAPSRLARARALLAALAERARGDRLGLVAFAGEARTLMPLTRDTSAFLHQVERADPTLLERGGTDLAAALDAGLALLAEGDGAAGALLLLSDGEDLGGEGLAGARRARTRGVPVFAVGLGTALGGKIAWEPLPAGAAPAAAGPRFLQDRDGQDVVSRLDAAGLRRLAEEGGGTYVDGSGDAQTLARLYERELLPRARARSEQEALPARPPRFQAPLALALLLFALAFALEARGTP